MNRDSFIAMAIWSSCLCCTGVCDELDAVLNVDESERPAYVARKLEEYASQFSSAVISLSATESGTNVNFGTGQENSAQRTSPNGKGRWKHELVLSAQRRFAKLQDINGGSILTTYNGHDGRRYGYDTGNEMSYVDHFCDFPSLGSMSLELFVNLTGITTYRDSSNEELTNAVRKLSWGERRVDSKFGDCIALQKESRDRLKLTRDSMTFGMHDTSMVLHRREVVRQSENEQPINGAPAIIRYKWLQEFEYGQKYGRLLPESWKYVIAYEYCDLDGRLLPLSNVLRKNPIIIRSTTTTISNVKFLDRFPNELFNIPVHPSVPLVDSCQEAVQMDVADALKSGSRFNYWLLGLGVAACAIGAYLYVRSRR